MQPVLVDGLADRVFKVTLRDMRIPMSCIRCSMERLEAEDAEDAAAVARGETPPVRSPFTRSKPEDWYLAEIEEDNAYVHECRNGHTIKASLQAVRYELLYESGVVAMFMGFQREAVSSLVAALERFYEFAIEVYTIRSKVDQGPHEAAWKQVRRQSERQLGAFLFLHLVNHGRPFLGGEGWSAYEKWVAFRNEVIHQGMFPSAKRTQEYARYVFELIRDARAAMQELDAEAVRKAELRHYVRSHAAVEAKAGPPKPDKNGRYWGPGNMAMGLMLTQMAVDEPTDFDARLESARKNIGRWGFPSR